MSAIVAIDGPSGVGKGTVARAVARALDWQYVDTGAMYRAVAWKTQQLGQSLDDEDVVAEVAGTASFEIDENRVMIDGHDVTRAIRTPEIDVAAATVARIAQVRAVLVERQRRYAATGPVVMEGARHRDRRLSSGDHQDLSRCVSPGASRASSRRSESRALEG